MRHTRDGRVASPPGSREPGSQAIPAASGFDPSRVRAWLVGLTKYGEDHVWRGAEKALACFDAMAAEIERLKRPRFGEPGYVPPAQPLHAYRPHRRWPWFCGECGYPEHERLKHLPRDTDGSEHSSHDKSSSRIGG